MIAFFVMTLFVVMSPGVDTALITKRTLSDGQKAGFQMALGITAGTIGHTLAATLGLSALIVQSAVAFTVVKWVGAAYLIYLGIAAFLPKKQAAPSARRPQRQRSAFQEGLFCNLLNPKVAVFFLTFLPQFVTSEQDALTQLFWMGCTYALLSILWFTLYVGVLQLVRNWLLSPAVQNWMEKATGAVLVGFGVKLLFAKAN